MNDFLNMFMGRFILVIQHISNCYSNFKSIDDDVEFILQHISS